MKFAQAPKCLNIILFLIFTNLAYGQSVLRGTITEAGNEEPLINASVVVKGTSIGTVTDFDGNFELDTEGVERPFTLAVTYVGFVSQQFTIKPGMERLDVALEEDAITTELVEVRGQRVSDKQKAAPLTVESLDVLAIKQTASDNFYDGLGTLKGVDLTAASLGFKVINTRGFNSTSPVRSLQLIDGVDNQSPGLNFSLGNFLGSPELDVLRVDLIAGASSAFYGPNAFNGVIAMKTKNPYLQKGLSASVKGGERNMVETAVRWADALQNEDGDDWLAYKFNFSYLTADDWEAENYDPIFDSERGRDNPGRYDAVNIYGDEYFAGFDFSTFPLHTYPGLDIFYRTGYQERDLVDYGTENLKANAAFHFRLNPEQGLESPEFILASNFGSGTTVYQGDNRFSLRNILFFQNRLEIRKQEKWFFRAYATHEDAGDSYDPFLTALRLQDSVKTNTRWSQDYVDYWLAEAAPVIQDSEEFPELQFTTDPETGQVRITFDNQAANNWLDQNQDLLFEFHQQAEAFANSQTKPGNQAFLAPGAEGFDRAFNELVTKKRTEGGTLFFDQSALYHAQGEYNFDPSWTDKVTVGASSRYYTPESQGTVFSDTAGTTITNFEFGFYGGIEKFFADREWKAQATLRVDKNENFDWLFSPAASMVWNPSTNNFLRFSFSSAIRNPTLTDQYLLLDVGPAILSGNLNGATDLVTLESLQDFLNTLNRNELEFFDIDPVQPEKVKTFEVGYRSTLFDRLYLDASYYYNIYNDFLGFQIGADLTLDQTSGRPRNVQVFRYSANSQNTVTTQGFAIGLNYYFARYFQVMGNYSWNRLNKQLEDDPIIPAFNTPEHKFNIGISGRDVPLRIGNSTFNNFGFKVNYKWIEGFLFEGSPQFTGLVPTYDLLDAQVNYHFDRLNTTLKVGASNLLNNEQFQTYGGPRIGRLAYVSLLYEFKKR